MSDKEKKEIKSLVESIRYLSVHDPQALMLVKSNIDVLKARSDMDRVKEPELVT